MPIEWAGPGLLAAMGGTRDRGSALTDAMGMMPDPAVLLAEEGALTFPHVATPLLVATVAAVVLWVLGLLVAAVGTRARGVDPGPATMDLGEEPPAVVDLLTNDWRVTPDAIPATLLDLAARDYVDLEQYGPGRTMCRLRRSAGEGLETYERMLLDHVAGLAVDGVVPAEALTTGPQDQSSRWGREFRRAVVDDARARGWRGTAGARRSRCSSGRPRWCRPGSECCTPMRPPAWTSAPSAPGW
jgi:Predicted membrane protein (DUF2207)